MLPAIKLAVCDADESVQEAASDAFDVLCRVMGPKAVSEIIHALMKDLVSSDENVQSIALSGLRQLIAVRPQQVLPKLIPALVKKPITLTQARALASISQSLSGDEIQEHISSILVVYTEQLCSLLESDAKTFVDAGLKFDDRALLAVLLNDAAMLEDEFKSDPSIPVKRISFRAAYTPLEEVTLLHVCAEFNHVACAEVLVKQGADVDAAAGIDEFGFGGQSPIFHTVNQNSHQSKEMMHFLLEQGAKLDITVKGIIWGKGYPWETLIPSVNPISYTMMGLLPQMHRNEKTINEVVSVLLKHQYHINYTPPNVPNKYLNS